MFRIKSFSFFPLLFLLTVSGSLHAATAERWYQVEVILFSQNSPLYQDSELWPIDFTLPTLEHAKEIVPASPAGAPALLPKPFSQVTEDRLLLIETAKRIKKAKDVELIKHLGWLQPGLPQDKAIPVHIYSGMLEAVKEEKTADETEFGNAAPTLDGTLRLILSRYLHLEADLAWKKPLPGFTGFDVLETPQVQTFTVQEESGEIEMPTVNEALTTEEALTPFNYQVFRMQQSRKMRSNEVHYIDHPLFGIIVQVTRYEPEKAEEKKP